MNSALKTFLAEKGAVKSSLEANEIPTINRYWMRFSVIARIIVADVCVNCRSRRLSGITQTEALIILTFILKPNHLFFFFLF